MPASIKRNNAGHFPLLPPLWNPNCAPLIKAGSQKCSHASSFTGERGARVELTLIRYFSLLLLLPSPLPDVCQRKCMRPRFRNLRQILMGTRSLADDFERLFISGYLLRADRERLEACVPRFLIRPWFAGMRKTADLVLIILFSYSTNFFPKYQRLSSASVLFFFLHDLISL